MKKLLNIHEVFYNGKTLIIIWPWFVYVMEYFFQIYELKATAVIPFVIIACDVSYCENAARIRHEKIHHMQMLETLFIGWFLIWAVQKIYFWIKGYNADERYYQCCFEQECYCNQHQVDYLTKRRPFAWAKYLLYKKHLCHKDGKLIIQEMPC